jgi:hypothetical protein
MAPRPVSAGLAPASRGCGRGRSRRPLGLPVVRLPPLSRSRSRARVPRACARPGPWHRGFATLVPA